MAKNEQLDVLGHLTANQHPHRSEHEPDDHVSQRERHPARIPAATAIRRWTSRSKPRPRADTSATRVRSAWPACGLDVGSGVPQVDGVVVVRYSMTVTIRRCQSENLEGCHYPNGAWSARQDSNLGAARFGKPPLRSSELRAVHERAASGIRTRTIECLRLASPTSWTTAAWPPRESNSHCAAPQTAASAIGLEGRSRGGTRTRTGGGLSAAPLRWATRPYWRERDSNPHLTAYEAAALPLSYPAAPPGKVVCCLCTTQACAPAPGLEPRLPHQNAASWTLDQAGSASTQRFELRFPDSESSVLPLDEVETRCAVVKERTCRARESNSASP
jgi:hypothetical protein